MRRSGSRHIGLVVAIGLSMVVGAGFPGASPSAVAQTVETGPAVTIPNFWDPKRRVERPPAGAVQAIRFVTTDDYPPSALRANEEGTSSISWTINTQGRVENCHVTHSSGHSDLDEAACRAITRRGRYTPAKDQNGNPITSTQSRNVVWRIPQD